MICGRRHYNLWCCTFMCIIWSLWFEQNKIKFEGGSISWVLFWDIINSRIALWTKGIQSRVPYSYWDLAYNFTTVIHQHDFGIAGCVSLLICIRYGGQYGLVYVFSFDIAAASCSTTKAWV